MKLLAIDPGYERSAFVALDGAEVVAHDIVGNGELLARLRRPNDYFPIVHTLAIEMIASYGMPVGREVFETVLTIGRMVECWERLGRAAELVYRRDVKLFHCHSARANDANIRAALIDCYGPTREKAIGTKKAPGPLYGIRADVWSALAIAKTAAARLETSPFAAAA